jgi:hypothetical protein
MSALASLSATATALYDGINAAASPDQLDNLARAIWHSYGKGDVADDETTFLTEAISKRRAPDRQYLGAKPLGRLNARIGSRFTPRQRPRSPDRQASRERRRRLGGSSALPDTLRHHYTEGQRAVLCIVAGEIKHHGTCDLLIDEIGALAGVCRTTVQTTLHEPRRLGHIEITERPVPGRKNLTNIVKIIFREWKTWIERGPMAHRPIGSKTLHNTANLVSPTKSTERKQEAWQGKRETGPPQPPLMRTG